MQKNTPHLSERNLKTLSAIGRMRYLSSYQIWKEFYPTTTYENASQRMTTLHRYGFVSRDAAYPKAVTNPGQRPTMIYFFSGKNKEKLREYLTTHGKADQYEEFAILPTTDKDDHKNFSNSHLVHEISVAEFFIPLEKAAAVHPQWELLMWEITSPRSADIPDKDLQVRLADKRTRDRDGNARRYTVERHFNPDGLAFLREPSGEVILYVLAACRREKAMANYKALRLVRSRPFAPEKPHAHI